MKYLFSLLTTLFSVVAISLAQQPEGALPKLSETPARIILEISYNQALPPAYISVSDKAGKPPWTWITRFVTISGGAEASTQPAAMRAVRLEPRFNGETVDVRVSILSGNQTFERETPVEIYHLGVGEVRKLSKLKTFGIQPFTIKILDSLTEPPSIPNMDIRVSAIQVSEIKRVADPLPGYRIAFKNLSQKPISALKIEVVHGVTALLQGEKGLPAIEANGTRERYVPVDRAQLVNGEWKPGPTADNTIIVSSVVFADRTFEGDPQPACLFDSFQLGTKMWLRQVIKLLDQQLLEGVTNSSEGAARLKSDLSAYDASSSIQNGVPIVSPGCSAPYGINISVKGQNLELFRDLDKLISSPPVPEALYTSWLKSKRDEYDVWLSRLGAYVID